MTIHYRKNLQQENPIRILYLCVWLFLAPQLIAQKIDRKALVRRHNLHLTDRSLRGPTQVGNGHFAFGFDITGLQTFNKDANTMSDWGWHKFPMNKKEDPYSYKGSEWDTQGRLVRYDVHNDKQKDLFTWMRANPQRINLGRLRLVLKKKDGSTIEIKDLKSPVQDLDLWTGVAKSSFRIEDKTVAVTTICHPDLDVIAIKIESPLLNDGRIMAALDFPYASHQEFGNGADWDSPDKHSTKAIMGPESAIFHRQLDSTRFDVLLQWRGGARLQSKTEHSYLIKPTGRRSIEITLGFQHNAPGKGLQLKLPSFSTTLSASIHKWKKFWTMGGAIDLSESKDPRWQELERRIILSQYLMEVNEAGILPPQESGLVNNGWYGKYHLEMLWWHGAQYALWGRQKQMDRLTSIYRKDLRYYQPKTKSQGYKGVRWPKTLGDHAHWEWPNEINPLLIWQQPHPIIFAELDYRNNPDQHTLDKWKKVVMQTADFMASYPYYNKREKRYILGYPLQVVSENANPRTTINPTFELSYWRTGLRIAQQWRKRLGLPESKKYKEILDNLSALPVQDGLYVSWENIYKMWSIYNFEHPALIGAYGMLPGDGVDTAIMNKTLNMVERKWNFSYTWGWDFPMLAMAAARLGHPEKALEFLLNFPGFSFDEHGLSGGGVAPYPYFPSNGGLLYAVAMMAAGWDGANGPSPGFPKDGSWKVRYEGLHKAL